MCIKIVRTKEEVKYDSSMPLEEQIRGSKQIVINYEPNDTSVGVFLGEINRLCKSGISANLNIKVINNNFIAGAMVKKQVNEVAEDLEINDLIKLMVTSHSETDKKLEELENYWNRSKLEQ